MTLLGIGSATLFDTVGFFAGDHWSLEDDEITALARAINGALDTLPGEYYALIRQVVEDWFPWVTLAVVAGKIVVPRYKYTVELWAGRVGETQSDKASNPHASGPIPRAATVNPDGEQRAASANGANAAGDHGYNKYGASGNFRNGLHFAPAG